MGALLCWCLCWRYRDTDTRNADTDTNEDTNAAQGDGHVITIPLACAVIMCIKRYCICIRALAERHWIIISHLPSPITRLEKRLFRGWVRLGLVDKLQNNNVAFIVRQRKAEWGCLVLSCSDKIFTQLLDSTRAGDIFTYWFSILNLRTKLIYHPVAARETVKTPWCFVPLNGCQYFSVPASA